MKVASDLIVDIPILRHNEFVTKARSILREDVFRELYVVDERNHLLGYLDITDVLRVTDTRSNVTIEGFIDEAATVHLDTPLEQVALAIRKARTNSAAVVDAEGAVRGGVLLSELFPVIISRHEIHGSVSDHMSRDVATCSPQDRVHHIYNLIVASGFNSFPVVEKNQEVVGIVSRRDVLRAGRIRPAVKNAADTTIERIMTTPVVVTSPDDLVENAARMMVKYDISMIPVVQNGRIAGVIDRHDVLNALTIRE